MDKVFTDKASGKDTGTAGFTDHVFVLMHLLGFRFAPRIRDLGNAAYDGLKPLIGGTLNIKHVRAHWDEILRLLLCSAFLMDYFLIPALRGKLQALVQLDRHSGRD